MVRWSNIPEGWEAANSQSSNWADWHPTAKPESGDKAVLYKTLSQSLQAHPLDDVSADRLLIGFDAKTGDHQFMSMKNPRSLIIHDHHLAGADMLQTMAMGIKSHPNQKQMRIDILTADEFYWRNFATTNENVKIISSSSGVNDGPLAISRLPYNPSYNPRFLFLDDLHDFANWSSDAKSLLHFLIGDGAATSGIFVLANYVSSSNFKINNAATEVIYGNFLEADTTSENSININNQSIWVPNPA